MKKGERSFQLHKRQKDMLFYLSLAALALLAFLFVGAGEPVLYDDSGSYMRMERYEGVMPLYPLFLLCNQWLFGLDNYLWFVIIEQASLAAVCVILFVREIKNRFSLWYSEGYLLFFLTLLPFTTELPQAMMTQAILTEGIAYSLFYLLILVFLRAVWERSFRWNVVSFVLVFLLAMLRSQLQMLFGVCGIVFFYLLWQKKGSGRKRIIRIFAGLSGCVLIALAGIGISARTLVVYHSLIRDNIKINMAIMKIQDPAYYQEFQVGEDGADRTAGEMADAVQKRQEKNRALGPTSMSQYTSLIFSRGMYEADAEDAQLFEDETVRELYQAVYEEADREGLRYVYGQKGLWMWRDIVGGIGRVGKTGLSAGDGYYREKYPELYESESFNEIWNRNMQTIGITLLKRHFGRFLYHSLMLLPQAFICTVFFQIAPVYLLCHFVMLFLYLSAFGLMVWGYADRRTTDRAAEFMALVLGMNVVMVVLISLVFFGQQRYLVYNFGIFYIAYYVLLRQLWIIRIRPKISGKLLRGRGAQRG